MSPTQEKIVNEITALKQNGIGDLQFTHKEEAKLRVMNWNTLPSQRRIDATITALKANGIDAVLVASKDEAKEKVLSMLPAGAEVMTMTSETLRVSGIEDAVNESKDHVYLKDKLYAMEDGTEKRKTGAAPEYALGSVHAVTQNGHIIIASNLGSQLPAYAYGAGHVIWVVGVQKIVETIDGGMKRIYDYILPLESERARIAYGVPGSNVSKILIVNKEIQPHRISLIFINESIGF